MFDRVITVCSRMSIPQPNPSHGANSNALPTKRYDQHLHQISKHQTSVKADCRCTHCVWIFQGQHDLTFQRIYGAGHMVPKDQPPVSL